MATRGKKFLIGCGIGCGALILIAVVLMVTFAAWISRPGELLEPENLLSSDTLGFVEWTLSLDDPGTQQFMESLYERGQAQRADGQTPLPPELEKLLLGWQDKRNRESFEQLFPLSAAWLLRAGEETQPDRHLFSLSLQTAGNRLVFTDWLLGLTLRMTQEEELQVISYKDENLFLFDLPGKDPLVVFLRGNDVFFTYDLDTARQAVDRLTEPEPQRQPNAVEGLFARAPETQPLRGALSNARGEIFRSWEKVAVKIENREAVQEMTDALQGITLSGALGEDGQLLGRLELLCPDAEWASRNTEAALQAFYSGLQYDDLELGAQAKAEGNIIRIEFQLGGFFNLLDRMDVKVQ